MRPNTLKVYSAANACVTKLNTDGNVNFIGVREFIGRVYDPTLGVPIPGTQLKTGGFRLLADPVEIPFHPEYIKALQQGDLIAADAETASAANLNKF